MPRFSIIVPSYGDGGPPGRVDTRVGEGRLSLALDSVLAQSYDDFEVIAVADAPDSVAAAVAARQARRDARVTPVRSRPSQGRAGALNAGMRAATGVYLLFLDGDDTLAPGALAALDARLAETGDVDVLYAEHERVPWWEGEAANPAAPLLAKTPTDAFSPVEAPHVTGVQLPVWGTLYRRSFLTEHELVLPDGHFTDLGFGGLVSVHAGRIAVLRSVVVRHLLRRQGDPLNQPGAHHMELLERVGQVLSRAAEAGLTEDRSGPLFEQLFAVVLKTAAHPTRLAGHRRAFFRRAGRLYRRHRPAGFRRPAGSLGVQHRLLAAGAYTAFRALRGANRKAAAVARRVPRARALRTRLYYRSQLIRPHRPRSGRVLRLLGPRLRLQPGRDPRQGGRTRPAHPLGVPRRGRSGAHPAGGRRPRRHRQPPLLAAAGPRQVPGQQRQLRGRGRQTPWQRAPVDAARHAAEEDGHRAGRAPGGRRRHRKLRPAARPDRPLGLQPQLEPAVHRGVGAVLPVVVRDARVRLSAQRRLLHRVGGRRAPGARASSACPRAVPRSCTPPPTATTTPAPTPASTSGRCATPSATTSSSCCAPTTSTTTTGPARTTGGSSTSPGIVRRRTSASPRTPSSRTTRRSCSTTPTSTGPSSCTPTTGTCTARRAG